MTPSPLSFSPTTYRRAKRCRSSALQSSAPTAPWPSVGKKLIKATRTVRTAQRHRSSPAWHGGAHVGAAGRRTAPAGLPRLRVVVRHGEADLLVGLESPVGLQRPPAYPPPGALLRAGALQPSSLFPLPEKKAESRASRDQRRQHTVRSKMLGGLKGYSAGSKIRP